MASFASQRALRASILRLPPDLRSPAFQHRAFSSSPSRSNALLDLAVSGPSAVLNGIHALGIPWYATIPLTAVLVRGAFVHYFSGVPQRKKAQKRALLMPLITARRHVLVASRFAGETADLQRNNTWEGALRMHLLLVQVRAHFAALREVGKSFGAPFLSARSFVNFSMLIAFAEAIRLKCGHQEGLLSLLLTPFEKVLYYLDPQSFPKKDPAGTLAATQSQTGSNAGMEAVADTSRAAEILDGGGYNTAMQSNTTLHAPSPMDSIDTASTYFDPTLTTEGLSWCTDLTLRDPTLFLPATLTITMILVNILRPTVGNPSQLINRARQHQTPDARPEHSQRDQTLPKRPKTSTEALLGDWPRMTILQRMGIFISFLFGYAALQLPAGILLYLIPSIATGWLQSRWLDSKYPLAQPIEKCARPMRLKAKRQWVSQNK